MGVPQSPPSPTETTRSVDAPITPEAPSRRISQRGAVILDADLAPVAANGLPSSPTSYSSRTHRTAIEHQWRNPDCQPTSPALTVAYLMLLGWLDEVRVGYLIVGVVLVMAGSAAAMRSRHHRVV